MKNATIKPVLLLIISLAAGLNKTTTTAMEK